jgi:hypothetical protein
MRSTKEPDEFSNGCVGCAGRVGTDLQTPKSSKFQKHGGECFSAKILFGGLRKFISDALQISESQLHYVDITRRFLKQPFGIEPLRFLLVSSRHSDLILQCAVCKPGGKESPGRGDDPARKVLVCCHRIAEPHRKLRVSKVGETSIQHDEHGDRRRRLNGTDDDTHRYLLTNIWR